MKTHLTVADELLAAVKLFLLVVPAACTGASWNARSQDTPPSPAAPALNFSSLMKNPEDGSA